MALLRIEFFYRSSAGQDYLSVSAATAKRVYYSYQPAPFLFKKSEI
jgi:hypothetical protein